MLETDKPTSSGRDNSARQNEKNDGISLNALQVEAVKESRKETAESASRLLSTGGAWPERRVQNQSDVRLALANFCAILAKLPTSATSYRTEMMPGNEVQGEASRLPTGEVALRVPGLKMDRVGQVQLLDEKKKIWATRIEGDTIIFPSGTPLKGTVCMFPKFGLAGSAADWLRSKGVTMPLGGRHYQCDMAQAFSRGSVKEKNGDSATPSSDERHPKSTDAAEHLSTAV